MSGIDNGNPDIREVDDDEIFDNGFKKYDEHERNHRIDSNFLS